MIKKQSLLDVIKTTARLKVLYVEDNEITRVQSIKMFENYFNNIDVACDGIDGLEKYNNYFIEHSKYYDLIITDIEMPNMNGIEFSKSVKDIFPTQRIIVVSAYSDTKYFIDLINLGVNGFIQKPLSFEQVTDALYQVCDDLLENSKVELGNNSIYDRLENTLYVAGDKVATTHNEQKFIEFITQHSNKSLEEIFSYIYYEDPMKDYSPDSIKGLVKRLRKKLPLDTILHDRITGYSFKNM